MTDDNCQLPIIIIIIMPTLSSIAERGAAVSCDLALVSGAGIGDMRAIRECAY
jgi:hypothetical protein